MIANCPNCKPHPFQDGKYGFKMRVFNVNDNGKSGGKKARCTVCGDEKTSEPVKTKKADAEASGKKAKAKK